MATAQCRLAREDMTERRSRPSLESAAAEADEVGFTAPVSQSLEDVAERIACALVPCANKEGVDEMKRNE